MTKALDSMATDPVDHILTVDVEDWFHVLDADGAYGRERWCELEARVEANTDRLLALFGDLGARATFFIVGWVANRCPDLVRRIAAGGHEVASHSYWHEVMRYHDRASLSADLDRSRKLLEDLSGQRVRGFRAPGGSITKDTAWALEVVREQGFAYDSSLCPGVSSHGGFASPYREPHVLRCAGGDLLEVPSSTLRVGPWLLPYAGGGYLRLFPWPLVRAGFRANARARRPSVVYVHPREIDPGQPRMPLGPLRRFKYYVGLDSTERKLRSMLGEFRFETTWRWLEANREAVERRVLDVREDVSRAVAPADPARVPPPPPDWARARES